MAITLEVKQELPLAYLITLQDNLGVPIDIIGSTIVMKIRETIESPVVLEELSTTNGRITIGILPGQFSLYLAGTETATLGNGVFDIVLTTATSDVYLIAEGGKIKVKQIVSRA